MATGIFFTSELIWCYSERGISRSYWNRKHDSILFYAKNKGLHKFNPDEVREAYSEDYKKKFKYQDEIGWYQIRGKNIQGSPVQKADGLTPDAEQKYPGLTYRQYMEDGMLPKDWWVLPLLNKAAKERLGYPTQKPEILLERIIHASSKDGDIVADFFCGGGTTPAVAQRLNRRWIACDQSRIAVAITADRIAKTVQDRAGKLFPVPDFTIEHWGIYEAPKLEQKSNKEFREFVVQAFGGRPESVSPNIHGVRHGVPLFVGEPSRSSRIAKEDVAKFAQAVFTERRNNFGTMLAWNFGPDAKKAAEMLAARENKRIDFVRLSLVRLESDEFREHIVTKHRDYGSLLSFVQPPEVRIAISRIARLVYQFDVSESVSLNKDGKIANVQWDFSYMGNFRSTEGYSFLRDKKTGKPVLVVDYKFPSSGKFKVACSVQDDQGGERTEVIEVESK